VALLVLMSFLLLFLDVHLYLAMRTLKLDTQLEGRAHPRQCLVEQLAVPLVLLDMWDLLLPRTVLIVGLVLIQIIKISLDAPYNPALLIHKVGML